MQGFEFVRGDVQLVRPAEDRIEVPSVGGDGPAGLVEREVRVVAQPPGDEAVEDERGPAACRRAEVEELGAEGRSEAGKSSCAMVAQTRVGLHRPTGGKFGGGGLEVSAGVWRGIEQTPDPERTVSHLAVAPNHNGEERALSVRGAIRCRETGATDHRSSQVVREIGEGGGVGGELIGPSLARPGHPLLGRRSCGSPSVDNPEHEERYHGKDYPRRAASTRIMAS